MLPPSSGLVSIHHTTWHNNPENHEFYLHCHENINLASAVSNITTIIVVSIIGVNE
jgi:hypothetical protein